MQARVHPLPVAASPRLAALARRLERLEAEARGELDAWLAAGTPLIEPADDPRYRIVTFVTEAEPGAEVYLLLHTLTDRTRDQLDDCRLSPIPGTALVGRSYRLRGDHLATYQFFRAASPAEVPRPMPREAWRRILDRSEPDPRNPASFRAPRTHASILRLDGAQTLGVEPRGAPEEHRITSRALDEIRTVWSYPAGGPEEHRDLLVLLDGEAWLADPSFLPLLERRTAERRGRPYRALFVESGATRTRDLTCHGPFNQFLTRELVGWAEERWPSAPGSRRVLAGQSLGGLAAGFAALTAPAVFSTVVLQSPSLFWPDAGELDPEPERLARRFARSPRGSARIDLQIGLQEWMLLEHARHLRDVLEARGYDLVYTERNAGHEPLAWREGLLDAL